MKVRNATKREREQKWKAIFIVNFLWEYFTERLKGFKKNQKDL
jgi:hypothetical protein